MHIVTLTTCHNRRERTYAALSDLHKQTIPDDISITHVVVDDGSTDGTSKALSDNFPDVEVVMGNGQLYWAGGMRYGWEQSVRKKNFDYLFVYNDDVRLEATAIAELVNASEFLKKNRIESHVVVGSFKSNNGEITAYGGWCRSSRWHPLKFAHIVVPNGSLQKADTLNMNGALISNSALKKVGFLSEYFIHSGADFEYGLRLTKSGGEIYVVGQHIGTCDLNPQTGPLDERSMTLRQRIKLLTDIKREPFIQRFHYYKRHGGLFWPLLWISPYITVWFRHIWFSFLRIVNSYQVKSGHQ